MRGILWRWLFFFGAILWISLCLADYHKRYLQMNLKPTLKSMEFRIDPPAPPFYQIVPQARKLQPPKPALTFWKFLSIFFSVSAIVIIKRLSTFRKKSLPVSSCSDFDLIRAPYGSFISRVPPINNNTYNGPIYRQEFQVARLETNLNSGDTKPTALVGVKIVQKKLEDLENNIATLKQRINSNSTSNPGSAASDSIKKVFDQKLPSNQSYFGPVISSTDTRSTLSSTSPLTSEMKTRKDILLNHSRPLTPTSLPVIPTTPSNHNFEKIRTPDKSSRNSGRNSSIKEVKFNENAYELENDIISLRELKDSMSGKSSSYGTRKMRPLNFEETYEKAKKEMAQLKSNPISLACFNLSSKNTSKRNSSRNFRKDSKNLSSESRTLSDSKTNTTTCPSISSRKSHEGSSKSFPMDGISSTKMFTDSNSTTSTLTSIRKKRFLKSMKNRKKELKDLSPMSTSIATYLAPNFQSSSFPRARPKDGRHSSYAAINKKKAHTMKDLRSNTANMPKMSVFDRISVSSSNDSTDSIDKFVAKIMKPDSDGMLMKHSSDEMSMASTSISSLTASSSTFISGGIPKFDSVTNSIRSIRSILPLSRTTVSSNFSSLGNSRNMPAGAEPLSSGESLVEKSVSKYGTNLAIHSLAMNYLQTLEQKKSETDSQEKTRDSGSEFSFTTKSVLEKYKSKTKDSSVASSHQNILEDKYWLLHW